MTRSLLNLFRSPPRRLRRRAFAVPLCAAALALASCGRDPENGNAFETIAPAVEAVQARAGTLPLVERVSGTVLAENQIVLFPEIEGRIAAVLVESGGKVEKGQPLVQLRDDTLREQVRQAEAGHRINEARLRQAEAQFAQLNAETRRIRELGKRALVTELDLETATAQLAGARADVDLARAQLEQSAATLAEQRELLAKATIRAPIDGVVGQRNAEVGMQATPSTQLFLLGNLDRVKVRVNVTDTMLRHVAVGQPVEILTDGPDSGRNALRARLTRISPFLNEVSRSTEAEIEVANPEGRLRPGMFVPVDILYGESERATLIPTSALFTDPNTGRTGVFIVTGSMPAEIDTTRPAAVQPASASEQPGAAPQTPLTLSEPRPVEFRSANIVARGAMMVAVETVQPGDWIVTLGQDLLSTERQEARVRAVSWDHVLDLQSMQREDLLEAVLRSTSDPSNGNGSR